MLGVEEVLGPEEVELLDLKRCWDLKSVEPEEVLSLSSVGDLKRCWSRRGAGSLGPQWVEALSLRRQRLKLLRR